jgi:hypothetical protein
LNKAVLLSATAAAAILSCSAVVGASPVRTPSTMLWNQNSNFGYGVSSQVGTGTYADAAADDFVIPSGRTWRIAEVDVTGVYFNGSGSPAAAITFYTDKNGKPGRIKQGPIKLDCTNNAGSLQCILPKRVKLSSGTWWLSVAANCDFGSCGEWEWTENTSVHGNEAVWEDPGAGGKCATWKPLHVCFAGSPADLAFDLIGKR